MEIPNSNKLKAVLFTQNETQSKTLNMTCLISDPRSTWLKTVENRGIGVGENRGNGGRRPEIANEILTCRDHLAALIMKY